MQAFSVQVLTQFLCRLKQVVDKETLNAKLLAACDCNDLESAQALVAAGASLKHYNERTPLHSACDCPEDCFALVRWILSTEDGRSTVNAQLDSLLLDSGDDGEVPRTGETPLMVAASHGISHRAVVELLLEHGADVNIRTDFDDSAEDLAAYQGEEEMVLLLQGVSCRTCCVLCASW